MVKKSSSSSSSPPAGKGSEASKLQFDKKCVTTEDAQHTEIAQTEADGTVEVEDGGHRKRLEAQLSGTFTWTVFCR